MKRSDDSPLNCFQVIPAGSVTSEKISRGLTAAPEGRKPRTRAKQRKAIAASGNRRRLIRSELTARISLMGGAFQSRRLRPYSALPRLSTFGEVPFPFLRLLHARLFDRRGQARDVSWQVPDPASRLLAIDRK